MGLIDFVFHETISKITRDLELLEREMPRIEAYALNETGKYARNKVKVEMRSIFDRPTPYTLNAMFLEYATPEKLYATLKFRKPGGNSPGHYLKPQVYGGGRPDKGFEKALKYDGFMPGNMQVVPTGSAPVDKYGNVPGSYIQKVISTLRNMRDRVFGEKGKKYKISVANIFLALPGWTTLPPGIYQRSGGRITKLFSFVKHVSYRRIFAFHEIAEAACIRKFPDKFREGADKALKGKLKLPTDQSDAL